MPIMESVVIWCDNYKRCQQRKTFKNISVAEAKGELYEHNWMFHKAHITCAGCISKGMYTI